MFRVNCMTYVIIKGVFIHKIMYILCKFNFIRMSRTVSNSTDKCNLQLPSYKHKLYELTKFALMPSGFCLRKANTITDCG